MIRTGKHRTLLILFISGFLFAFQAAFAQADDTIAQGIIKVRRAPVPSEYYVKLDYEYHQKKSGSLLHYFRPRGDGEMILPPDPVTADPNMNDTNETLLDSSFMITFYNKLGKPAQEFAWIEWLQQYEHTFEWDDSAGIDSTTFVFEVNARGQVKCTAVPVAKQDSSAERLQKNLFPIMKKLWIWYPASTITDDGRRQKKKACTVRVKVYAVKIGYNQNLPLKIVD